MIGEGTDGICTGPHKYVSQNHKLDIILEPNVVLARRLWQNRLSFNRPTRFTSIHCTRPSPRKRIVPNFSPPPQTLICRPPNFKPPPPSICNPLKHHSWNWQDKGMCTSSPEGGPSQSSWRRLFRYLWESIAEKSHVKHEMYIQFFIQKSLLA